MTQAAPVRPILAVTMGDPSGIGPEILVKSLSKAQAYALCRPLAVGSISALRRIIGILGAGVGVREAEPESAAYTLGAIDVFDPWHENLSRVPFKQISVEGGRSSAEAVIAATRLAMDRRVDAIVTGPIHKEAINLAGYHYAGHTELLADLTKSPGARMLLVAPTLRVIHNSTHVSLREAIERVTTERVLHCIRLLHDALVLMGFERPRIAVNGLNPHAGEHGLFGTEDREQILPAIEAARAAGLDVSGPEPADTVYNKAVNGRFDGIVAMYHDQGHVAVKLAGFFDGVNVSLGLPIIRTSVDHGTAYGRAGEGRAREDSLDAAIALAAKMAAALRPAPVTAGA
ncbi:MAG: 4-hydroxythreonine-4-phosphate dehydrogenase PdxA [Actinobacteria bacterium]|nr:4-hydroxythreonine-4-phosphate dehydrogenase PdxA [Actinomycetota bacterium]